MCIPYLSPTMNPINLVPLSLLVSLFLLLHRASGTEPLSTICSSSGNYTAGDPYSHSLRKLVGSLAVTAPPTGFSLGYSVGHPTASRVYGLAQCRGDVTSIGCKACIVDAGNQIRWRCPHQRSAIIWFDNCLLRYSDEDFFGVVDNNSKLYLVNVQSVPDPVAFNRKVAELMGRVTVDAHIRPRLFSTGVAEAGVDGKLYGLAQCTGDLSSGDCLRCLQSATAELPTFSGGKRGGRVVGASCNIRYELYPFFSG